MMYRRRVNAPPVFVRENGTIAMRNSDFKIGLIKTIQTIRV